MNRGKFLKSLLGLVGIAAVAPSIAATPEEVITPTVDGDVLKKLMSHPISLAPSHRGTGLHRRCSIKNPIDASGPRLYGNFIYWVDDNSGYARVKLDLSAHLTGGTELVWCEDIKFEDTCKEDMAKDPLYQPQPMKH